MNYLSSNLYIRRQIGKFDKPASWWYYCLPSELNTCEVFFISRSNTFVLQITRRPFKQRAVFLRISCGPKTSVCRVERPGIGITSAFDNWSAKSKVPLVSLKAGTCRNPLNCRSYDFVRTNVLQAICMQTQASFGPQCPVETTWHHEVWGQIGCQCANTVNSKITLLRRVML